jgi:hypothetical protein
MNGVLDFPALNDLITLQFYSNGKTIPEVASKLNVFKRQLFNTWKSKAYAMFESTGLFGGTRQEHGTDIQSGLVEPPREAEKTETEAWPTSTPL